MTMKKISLIALFLMLTNCGYDAIYSKNNSLNVLVNKIETSGDKNINRIIVSSIKVEEEKAGYQIELFSTKNLEVVSKDGTGNASIYRTTITVDFLLSDQAKTIKQKRFSSNFTYNNIKNKFDLKQYQKNVEINLINKITEEIFTFLKT
jgi:hypothetical protein|tara:strand:+ start:247 stop:693 length:447 start_codon:yes stop_codon:yes gene_type:complete